MKKHVFSPTKGKKAAQVHEKRALKSFLAGSWRRKAENRFGKQQKEKKKNGRMQIKWPIGERLSEKKYSNDPFHVIDTIFIPHISTSAALCSF